MAWSRNDNALEHLARFGYAARGLVYLMIGGFVLAAAWTQGPSEASGLSGAFALRAQPYGWGLLAIVAAGHFAFAFGLIQARYRRIDAPDLGEADGAIARARRSLG